MNQLPHRLARIEARLQAVVEGSAARLFPGRAAPPDLTHQLLQAMQRAARPAPGGALVAPNLYRLQANPQLAAGLQATPAFLSELCGLLQSAAGEAGLQLSGPLSVVVEADARLAPGAVQVLAVDSLQEVDPTHAMRLPTDLPPEQPPEGAFLIVNGTEIYPLGPGVVNIGRRPDNQLVIDDPRISRLHAQLRLVRSRYVLFDLDSTGGTFVNGRRISQHPLQPGDVISLAGVPLVYGQDRDERADTVELRQDPG
ncbi:MAG: FhaA domain-containing protein [Chloroflexota bacterium]